MRHLATFKTNESMYGTQEKYGMCWQKKKGAAIDFSPKNKFILSTENQIGSACDLQNVEL